MQKIKSALTGHSDSTSSNATSGDRTSREYNSTSGSGSPENYLRSGDRSLADTGAASGERLTGDGANTGTNIAHNGNFSNKNTTSSTGSSGLTGQNTTSSSQVGSGLTGSHNSSNANASSTGVAGAPTTAGTTGLPGTRGVPGSSSTEGVSGSGSNFADKHTRGHDSTLASKFDPSAETTHHDHKHLQHVTHRDVHHIETEEVLREREHDRHIHHVQHHVQPVKHQEINPEVHHEKAVPVTKVHEQHVNTDEDRQLFRGLGEKHRDQETHRPKERTVVDLGEKVHENVHHHVHHLTQPVVQTEVQDRHKIHTVIPVHHTTHEAPIIHKSSVHEPIHMADFKKGGGVLGSGISMENAGVLNDGECSRQVDGVGEKLAQELHLGGGSSHGSSGATTGTTASNTTATR